MSKNKPQSAVLAEFEKRNKELVCMVNAGKSFRDVGKIFGVSRQRASVIYHENSKHK